jgi:hypothetical protein
MRSRIKTTLALLMVIPIAGVSVRFCWSTGCTRGEWRTVGSIGGRQQVAPV